MAVTLQASTWLDTASKHVAGYCHTRHGQTSLGKYPRQGACVARGKTPLQNAARHVARQGLPAVLAALVLRLMGVPAARKLARWCEALGVG